MEYLFNHIMTFILTLLIGVGIMGEQSNIPPTNISLLSGTATALVVSVIDGDTIEVIIGASTQKTKVRYIGINTPEPYLHQTPECGSVEASNRNKELVHNKTVTLVPGLDPYDEYGRVLSYVYVDGIFVNEILVREGYATVMMVAPNIQYKTSFSTGYRDAREHQLGIWNLCE